jgi:hypothetical protein
LKQCCHLVISTDSAEEANNLIFVFNNVESLTTCGTGAFKNNFYKNMVIIDSLLTRYVIESAVKTGYAGRFWGLSLLYTRLIKVKLIFNQEPYSILLDDVKRIMCRSIDNHSFWLSSGCPEELKKAILSSSTFDELIKLPFLPKENE